MLWPSGHQITAVELDPSVAGAYAKMFPLDNVVKADAHSFLLNNFEDFDFIWSSPPCPTHSKAQILNCKGKGQSPKYIDCQLWQEIILLKTFYRGVFAVENVVTYYEPLVKPSFKQGRHYYWTSSADKPAYKKEEHAVLRLRKSVNELIEQYGLPKSILEDVKDIRRCLRRMLNPKQGLEVFAMLTGGKDGRVHESDNNYPQAI